MDARLELVDDVPERDDVEHALAVTHDVDEVVARARQHRRGAVQHEARARPVVTEVFAEEAVLDEAGVLFDQEAVEEPSGDEIEAIEQFREFLDQVTPEDFAHGAE